MIEKWSYDALGNILTHATSTLGGGWATDHVHLRRQHRKPHRKP